MSRQIKRQMERVAAKAERSASIIETRKQRGRALLERQSVREKAGAYEGRRSVASALAPSRSRINSRKVQKGQFQGRIIKTVDGYDYHATKGWRRA